MLTTGLNLNHGYVAGFNSDDGNPISNTSFASFGVSDTNQAGPCHARVKDVVVDSFGYIHVLGEYRGAQLIIREGSQNDSATTSVTAYDSHQKVFLASFDANFDLLGCHVFYTDSSAFDLFAGGLAVNTEQAASDVFFAVNARGSRIKVETFFGASTPVTPFNDFSLVDPNGYDIYVGRLNVANIQIDTAVAVGDEGDEFASDLAGGAFDYGSLYMIGVFNDKITFHHSQFGTIQHTSAGHYDLFAVQFPVFDLANQWSVVAGYQNIEMALAVSDNGRLVGGFVTDSTFFAGIGNIPDTIGISLDSGYALNGKREAAFVGMPNYYNGTWEWVNTLGQLPEDSRVTSLDEAYCADVAYVAVEYGMHANVFIAPEVSFMDDHLMSISYTDSTGHDYGTNLYKGRIQSTGLSKIWNYKFLPTAYSDTDSVIQARFVSDIDVLDYGSSDSIEVFACGRFGNDIQLPFVIHNQMDSLYDGNLTGAQYHDRSGMFVFSLDEYPQFQQNEFTVCIFGDSFEIPVDPSPKDSNIAFNLDSIWFDGPGFSNPNSGYFVPSLADTGTHEVYAHFDYFGCVDSQLVAIVDVYKETFPYHPSQSQNGWGFGYSAQGWAGYSPPNKDNVVFDLVFNGGQYEDTLMFRSAYGGYDTIASRDTTYAGYVTAFSPCGVYWVTNFIFGQPGTGGTVQKVLLDTADSVLYVCGTKSDSLIIENSLGYSAPPNSTNPLPIGTTTNSNRTQKGFVAKLDALTGRVIWVYLGGDGANDLNKFHGIDKVDDILFVAGEHIGPFDFGTQTGGTAFGWRGIYLAIDTNQADPIHRKRFGPNTAGSETFVGAISAITDPYDGNYQAVMTGYFGPGSGTMAVPSSGWNYVPNTSISSRDVFIANVKFNGSMFSQDELVVFNSPGADIGLDVEFLALNYNDSEPFEITFCGQFETEMDTDYVNSASPPVLPFGGSGKDGFVASARADLTKGLNWFTKQGSVLNNEAVASLDYDGEYLYATGMYQDSALSLMLTGSPDVGNETAVFLTKFEKDSTFVNNNFAFPQGGFGGGSIGLDVSVMDTSYLVSGFFDFNTAVDFQFGAFATLQSENNNAEIFVARAKASNAEFFKKSSKTKSDLEDEQSNELELVLFPNPNNGSFTLNLNMPISGTLSIFNAHGNMEFLKSLNEARSLEIATRLYPGVHWIRIDGGGVALNTKFVVVP